MEPLVPVGGKPRLEENAALTAALLGYAKRSGPDDFTELTRFLDAHPQSPWRAALLTDLGFEYYNTAHYSRAIESWSNAWSLAEFARDAKSLALVHRAFAEWITMDARLGRMNEMSTLLKSIGNQRLLGPAAEKVVNAREALWNMQNRPQISFRCGPMALRSICLAQNLSASSDLEIFKSASTQKGCSLPQVAELSKKIGLNYQMAFRGNGEFIVPSVVHWKVGHYAALISKTGNLYELQDPTFGNKTWATKEALDEETSGYFLVPPGRLPDGWRAVDEKEGAKIWGKGLTGGNDSQHIGKCDLKSGGCCSAVGMARASIHFMDVNLNLSDQPLGYIPPLGPPARFYVRYNQRDVFQPANFPYGNLGALWTIDWCTYITDTPSNQLADVNLYLPGGGQRTYTGFSTNTQSFVYQQYDRNLLTRTGPASYQLLSGDGSKMIFSQSDGSSGSTRNIFLTQEIDPQGNALTFLYNSNLCLVSVVDAIGQVTTLTYGLPSTNIGSGPDEVILAADPYKLTKVTDPFGRSATLNYQPTVVSLSYTYFNGQISSITPAYAWELESITDVIGITSHFGYETNVNQINQFFATVTSSVNSLTTPYGTTKFVGTNSGNSRSMQITYPDGSRELVEYDQQNTNQPDSEPISKVPTGMLTTDSFLEYRNSYYWDRTACAMAYGDHSKARLFHFLHTENGALTSGCLESMKNPLESRVWYDYAGQSSSVYITSNTLPAHIGRVLDDGTTQLFTHSYNPFGRVTNSSDPLGRTLSFIYDTNGIDLLEVRQTRSGNNELLIKATYNSQHLPLTITDAAGQKTVCSYNARGQVTSVTNPRDETTTLTYDTNGYLVLIDGPLAGTNDARSLAYDNHGRVHAVTSPSGHTIIFNYDDLDRMTQTTFPDGTSYLCAYDRLDFSTFQDRAGRQTSYFYDNMRHVSSVVDPLGRQTYFDWCRCGSLKSVTDPMGRTTSWLTDVQGRRIAKQYSDGSQVLYNYENSIGRLREMIDENQQTTAYTYNLDNTIHSISYGNAIVPTPTVSFTYDANYPRVASVTDGAGTTAYNYIPITSTPVLGASLLGSQTGPLPNETIIYSYDELGRLKQSVMDDSTEAFIYDAAGRMTSQSNCLGAFNYSYDGDSGRMLSKSSPNGETEAFSYGNNVQDHRLEQITHDIGATPLSEFIYGLDIPADRIATWSQRAGTQPASTFSFSYDLENQLLSASVTNSGVLVDSYAYSYDGDGNRLTEQHDGTNYNASHNALNQISVTTTPGTARTNEWDAAQRLTAVNVGNQRTEFTYDGMNRLSSIRQLVNGSQVLLRYFAWCNGQICEERDASSANVTKRYVAQGMKVESGVTAGNYYYSRDHIGSIRELTDSAGNVRARYTYDPFGRKSMVSGDVQADFGFAGMFWSPEAGLALTRFRAYDPELGRWLSRDPLQDAEIRQGPNLYAYVLNEPINSVDPMGLITGEQVANAAGAGVAAYAGAQLVIAFDSVTKTCFANPALCIQAGLMGAGGIGAAAQNPELADDLQNCESAVTTEVEIQLPRNISGWTLNLEKISSDILEEDIPADPVIDIEARAADLKQTYEESASQMQADYAVEQAKQNFAAENLTWTGNVPPALWTEDMITIDRIFNNLAMAYARAHGVSDNDAWQAIVRLTGFDPDLW